MRKPFLLTALAALLLPTLMFVGNVSGVMAADFLKPGETLVPIPKAYLPTASAATAPIAGVTISDFGGLPSPPPLPAEAHWIWYLLFSSPAMFIGLQLLKLFNLWLKQREFAKEYRWAADLIDFASWGVDVAWNAGVKTAERDANGKLTPAAVLKAQADCRAAAVAFAKTRGVDLMKKYGPEMFQLVVEYVIGLRKGRQGTVPVAGPLSPVLSELLPLMESGSALAKPESTIAACG